MAGADPAKERSARKPSEAGEILFTIPPETSQELRAWEPEAATFAAFGSSVAGWSIPR
jgi:hypothetical protein